IVRALGSRCLATGQPHTWGLAEKYIQVMSALSRRLNDGESEAWCEFATGVVYFWQGRMPEAAVHLARADGLWSDRCVGVAREQSTTRLYLGRALFSSGRVAE